MMEIMKKVNELLEMLTVKNGEADALSIRLRGQAEEQETTRKVQTEKDAELKDREVKVARVENVLAIEQKNQETLRKIAQEKESLANDASTHRQQVAKDKSEIVIREQGIKDDFAALKKREAKLFEDQKQLEEDKKTYKEKIVAKIGAGIKV